MIGSVIIKQLNVKFIVWFLLLQNLNKKIEIRNCQKNIEQFFNNFHLWELLQIYYTTRSGVLFANSGQLSFAQDKRVNMVRHTHPPSLPPSPQHGLTSPCQKISRGPEIMTAQKTKAVGQFMLVCIFFGHDELNLDKSMYWWTEA